MAVELKQEGARVYLVGLPISAKDRAKEVLGMGGKNFDWDRKCWWVGAAKKEAAEKFVAELNAAPADAPAGPEDVSEKRVYAKVTHQGKTYYVIGQTMTPATATQCALPLRVRLVGFAEGSVPFWTDAQACELQKEYPGREVWDGRRGNGTVTRYTTMGGLRGFVAGQKKAEADGLPQCAECRKRSGNLIEDLEDGLMKCRGCCDIPSE